ncbi:MAG: peroxidase family protein [Pseudomonadota bacterium]
MNARQLILTTSFIFIAQFPQTLQADTRTHTDNRISPARDVQHKPKRNERRHNSTKQRHTNNVRSIDGSGNNDVNSEMGASYTPLARLLPVDYADGLSTLAGANRASPRQISNIVVATTENTPNASRATDYLWQWGQFLDHDIDLTEGADPAEPANIAVPDDDPYFPAGSEITFNRSIYDSGANPANPRQQLNEITAWIDASNVYGSDPERAQALRTLDGTGQLKTSAGDLLPFNTVGLPNAGGDSDQLFLAGDIRANEQIGLTALHTLFVREHNRLAAEIANDKPDWNDEQIYQHARRIVGAQMQVITYKEYLPALLGGDTIKPYRGYDPTVIASISNSFSTAAYRYGHSALSSTLKRINADGSSIAAGDLPLRNAFFSPWRIAAEGGLEPILRGLAAQRCQTIDSYLVEDVRSFLFGDPSDGGFDLAALNIQRGRDHGLPSYNQARQTLGMEPARNVTDITSDTELRQRLRNAYTSVDDIDLWVGGLAEDAQPSSHLGPLFSAMIADQFEALRNGDRFWYQRHLSGRQLRDVERTRLADIIRRNTDIGEELGQDVFAM